MRAFAILPMLVLLAAAPLPSDEAAVVRAALAAAGRSACTDPKRQPGAFADMRAERARDDRGGKLELWFERYFALWWQPTGSEEVPATGSERLLAASRRLWTQPAEAVVRARPPDLDQPGPCNGLVVGAVEWMDGIAFVEVGERLGVRAGNGTLWAFEQRGDAWVPLGQKTTWII